MGSNILSDYRAALHCLANREHKQGLLDLQFNGQSQQEAVAEI